MDGTQKPVAGENDSNTKHGPITTNKNEVSVFLWNPTAYCENL